MTINERIRILRKDKLRLTLEEFGKHFGVTKVAFSKIENGQRGVTEQMILSICREFSVREEWLRTGEGEPFAERSREEQIRDYFSDLEGLSEELKDRLLDALAAIQPEDWKLIEQLVNRIVAESRHNDAAPPADTPPADSTALTPDEQEMLRQYREKKNQAGGSSASSAG